MSIYEPVFSAFGLTGGAGCNGKGDNLSSLADLVAKARGEGSANLSLWELPFPSMDALHASCPAFPKSRELSKGIENVFHIKDSLSLVLIRQHSRLAGF